MSFVVMTLFLTCVFFFGGGGVGHRGYEVREGEVFVRQLVIFSKIDNNNG